LYFVWSI
jgi:DNA-directed RNA polymerase II subunit RPB2